MGHELEDAGSHTAPELQTGQDGDRAELVLVLVLIGRDGRGLLAVDGPQLGEHEGVEQRTHVQH